MYGKHFRQSERGRQRPYRDGDDAILRTVVRANLLQGNRKWGVVSVATSLVLTMMVSQVQYGHARLGRYIILCMYGCLINY